MEPWGPDGAQRDTGHDAGALIHAGKGLADPRALRPGSLPPHLASLSLARNALTALRALPGALPAAAPSTLRRLDLQRNQLACLEGLQVLTALTSLNLAANRLGGAAGGGGSSSSSSSSAAVGAIGTDSSSGAGRVLAPLAALTQLRQLALHRNRLTAADLAAGLPPLARLPLAQLSTYGNPGAAAAGAAGRAATLAALLAGTPNAAAASVGAAGRCQLQFLDGGQVTPAELAAAGEALSWQQLAAPQGAGQQRTAAAQAQLGSAGAASSDGALKAQLAQQQAAGQETRSGSSSRGSSRGEARGAAGRQGSISSSSAGTMSFQDVASLLPSLAVATTKPSTLRPLEGAAAVRKEPPVVEFRNRHPNGMPSIVLRRNATGSVSWPSGGLAASADLDALGGYRLMAMHDGPSGGGSVAASADAAGGFAQYADGGVALSWKRGEGGAAYGRGGALLARWGGRKCGQRLQSDLSLDLGSGFSASCLAGSGDCVVALALGQLHAEFAAATFSQRAGMALVCADGSRWQPAAGPQQQAAEACGGSGAEGAAAAGGVSILAALEAERSKRAARAAAGGPSGSSGGQAAQAARPRARERVQVGGAGGGAGGGGVAAAMAAAALPAAGDVAALIARAQALMARSDAEGQGEAEQ